MKIIGFITEPAVIRQVLQPLGLWAQTLSRDPPDRETLSKNSGIIREPFGPCAELDSVRVGCVMRPPLMYLQMFTKTTAITMANGGVCP